MNKNMKHFVDRNGRDVTIDLNLVTSVRQSSLYSDSIEVRMGEDIVYLRDYGDAEFVERFLLKGELKDG